MTSAASTRSSSVFRVMPCRSHHRLKNCNKKDNTQFTPVKAHVRRMNACGMHGDGAPYTLAHAAQLVVLVTGATVESVTADWIKKAKEAFDKRPALVMIGGGGGSGDLTLTEELGR